MLGRPSAHQGVHDRLEPGPGLRVAEHQRSHRRAVEGTVGIQDGVAEHLDDPAQPGRARRHNLSGQAVGVDHDGTTIGQQLGGLRLAATDPAGQTDLDHDTRSRG